MCIMRGWRSMLSTMLLLIGKKFVTSSESDFVSDGQNLLGMNIHSAQTRSHSLSSGERAGGRAGFFSHHIFSTFMGATRVKKTGNSLFQPRRERRLGAFGVLCWLGIIMCFRAESQSSTE